MSKNLIALQNRFLGRGDTVYDKLAGLRESEGAITESGIAALSRDTGLPAANLRAVAEFYDETRLTAPADHTLRICNGEACAVAGAGGCRSRLDTALAGVSGVNVEHVTCVGYCDQGPNALLESRSEVGGFDRTVFSLADPARESQLIESLGSGVAPDFAEPVTAVYPAADPRANLLLRHHPAPRASLSQAREKGIYTAFSDALGGAPEAVIAAIRASQIRGRGGAGFPSGIKLETARTAPALDSHRYVVCNADEGDAGAYIDKYLLEQDPHSVIEGMLLAAIGADRGFVYLRAEYPTALGVFERAIAEAAEAGLLGADILGSGFDFDLRLVRGHGAYICGEETSLLRSLEGVPAQVSPRPPYPAVSGYRGAPTVVNNVETLAAFPWIVANGGEAYAGLGANKSRGTKLVSLNSAVVRPGLYEVELGITLRTLIFDLAGGLRDGTRVKAVQVGGPMGGILSEAQLDLPLEFEALAEAGAMLGHGGVVVFPEGTDMVEIGRGLMSFCAVESCGKCFPCRLGSVRGTELFDKILAGRGEQSDVDLLAELGETMRIGSLCALGGAIPLPIDNLLTGFIGDFQRHVPDAETPATLGHGGDA